MDLNRTLDVVARFAVEMTEQKTLEYFQSPRIASRNFVTGCVTSDVTGSAGSRGVWPQLLLPVATFISASL